MELYIFCIIDVYVGIGIRLYIWGFKILREERKMILREEFYVISGNSDGEDYNGWY